MKTLRKLLMGSASLLLAVVMFTACSSDDDNTQSTEDELVLDGQWQLEKMDFLDADQIKWDTSEVPYNRAAAFGYAPYMFDAGEISGFLFGERDVNDKDGNHLGQRFDYIMGGDFEAPQFDPNTTYWYWNYTNDQKSFEMYQMEGPLPPHDYTLHNIRDIEVTEDGEKIVFTADLSSREIGGERGDNIETPVKFTITKGKPSKFVDLYIDGEPYEEPVNPEGEPQ